MSKKHKAEKEKHGKGKDLHGKQAPSKAGKAPAKETEEQPAAVAPPSPPATSGEESPEKSSSGLSVREITLISKALADPTRMAVLRAIAKGSPTCSGLRDCAGISAATLSHHMKELESAGLIETERKGRFVSATLQRRTWKKYVEELKALSK